MPKSHSRRGDNAQAPRVASDSAVRPSEQLLIDVMADFPAERMFCTSLGRAQLARRFADRFPESQVTCLFLDIYLARRAETATDVLPANLRILCASDPPEHEFDLAALPLTQGGEAELTRDLMQSAHQQLRPKGQLVVAIDNPRDTWLHAEMQRLFDKVTRRAEQGGVIYAGTKRESLKKLKDFRCEFKFRDGERLISVVTRPGVFSHRRLDTGSRAMLEVMEISAGDRVLDLGSGAGVLSLAAAWRAEGGSVLAVDSNARAVECTGHNARLNGITSITTKLNAQAKVDEEETFDVVLANPPYFSNYRIAEIFLKGARRALKTGGQVFVVAKNATWYEENMPRQFNDVAAVPSRSYTVMRGTKR